jgi:hypothetical protein
VAHVVSSSTAMVFFFFLIENCKSKLFGTIQMKNWQQTFGTIEKLDTIHQLEKCELTVDICQNVRLAHDSAHTVRDNANRIKYVLSQELKCLFV